MMKNTKGITLVALVITIIILLILAGVAITALTQTGLFEKTKQAKNIVENAQNTENVILANYNNKINEILDGTREHQSQQSNIIYSKEEQVVGKWIDGKNIYSKTIDLGTNYEITARSIDIEKYIPDIDLPIEANMYMIDNENNTKSYFPTGLWRRSSGEWRINSLDTWDPSSTRHVYFYVKYTKN